jgi:HD-GYP domain-containing protein (c-di-GMP phosphodiesterase class II)
MKAHDNNRTATDPKSLQNLVARLNQIGIALSAEHSLNKLLALIVKEARRFTSADGGSLYIREGDKLNFLVAQTASLEKRNNGKPFFSSFYVPLTKESISGYVATTGQLLNIEDVYHIPPTVEYRFNRDFDLKVGYRSKSMLVVPMRDHQDDIIGVLQLINSLDGENNVVPFKKELESLILSLASQAAVAIRNAKLIDEVKALFRSLVRYSATAIDARSPHTAGHSGRVAKYSMRLARAINEEKNGCFGAIKFTPEQLEELRMAAWLHDIGKIGVKESVLEKANKLTDEQMEIIRHRFEIIRMGLINRADREKLELSQAGALDETASKRIDHALEQALFKHADDWAFLQQVNIPGYLAEPDRERLKHIAESTYVDGTGNRRRYLSTAEYENLSVIRGNLTPAEYKEIQSHVDYTVSILGKIPFTRDLANIPTFAASHHEMMDGSGYPRGLKGDEIPLQARIMCISDIFDALTSSDRPYKKSVPLEKSLDILRKEAAEGRLDGNLVDLFIRRELYRSARKDEDEDEKE